MSVLQKTLLGAALLGCLLLVRALAARRTDRAPNTKPGNKVRIAYVLLASGNPPMQAALSRALHRIAGAEATVEADADEGALTINLPSGSTVFALLVPMPVPGDEIEHASRLSLAAYGKDAAIAPHTAHLVVTEMSGGGAQWPSTHSLGLSHRLPRRPARSAFTGAAVGGVAHPTRFFIELAEAERLPLPAWIGVSIVPAGEDRVSVLGAGMQQLGLTDLLLSCPREAVDDGLAYFFDLLRYAVERGAAPADGDTVGRTATEQVRVRHLPSPLDQTVSVWSVNLER